MGEEAVVVVKRPWLSKTFWFGIILAISPLIPGVEQVVKTNPDIIMTGLGVVVVALRFITNGKISIKD